MLSVGHEDEDHGRVALAPIPHRLPARAVKGDPVAAPVGLLDDPDPVRVPVGNQDVCAERLAPHAAVLPSSRRLERGLGAPDRQGLSGDGGGDCPVLKVISEGRKMPPRLALFVNGFQQLVR
jgi:hypothetical protein